MTAAAEPHCIDNFTTMMYVIKRDGRREKVHFDKITSRIKKLCYGLNDLVDPVIVAQKVGIIASRPSVTCTVSLFSSLRLNHCRNRRYAAAKAQPMPLPQVSWL